jgi:delta24-sterol reductase
MGHPRPYDGPVDGKQGDYRGDYISVGIWGPHPSDESEYVRANRDIESKMRELGGLKWYDHVYVRAC